MGNDGSWVWQVTIPTVICWQETTNEIELARTGVSARVYDVVTVDRGYHVYVEV